MNISLTKDLEEYIKTQIKTGYYASVSEVIRDALRSHIKLSRTKELDQLINLGQKQVKEEKTNIVNAEFFNNARKQIKDKYS